MEKTCMTYEVSLPSLGDDATETATVSLWMVHEGDIVSEGDDLVEMVTDKAAFNVPSPKSGTVTEITVNEGDTVTAGDVLCVLEM